MTTSRNLPATVLLLPAILALLAGCAAPSTGGTDPGTGTGDDGAPAASGDFCADFETNGGGGATIGPVLTFVPKEDILADAQPRLDAMGDLEPPAEIATEWGVVKQYYADVVAAAEALPDGAGFNESPEYPDLAEAPDEYEVVSDYYFDNC
jgi:hypothetical protein